MNKYLESSDMDDYRVPIYWKNREERARHAQEWHSLMKSIYKEQIENSISNTQIILEDHQLMHHDRDPVDTLIQVVNKTTVGAITMNKDYSNKKIAALNFASYTSPGGKFMEGSGAQEESLCHNSTLYNVLEAFSNTYITHTMNGNRNLGLYSDDTLYSKDILFFDENVVKETKDIGLETPVLCDIITCAAPFTRNVLRYKRATLEECENAMRKRIRRILEIAVHNEVDILILGAFGCGVFGNNPKFVARAFADELHGEHIKNKFERVIFAVPSLTENDDTRHTFSFEFASRLDYQFIRKDSDTDVTFQYFFNRHVAW